MVDGLIKISATDLRAKRPLSGIMWYDAIADFMLETVTSPQRGAGPFLLALYSAKCQPKEVRS